jgi:DNA-binding XRE family transcriptional regulator
MITLNNHLHYNVGHDWRSIADDPGVAGKVSDKLERTSSTPAEALGAVITNLRLREKRGYEDVAHRVGCSAGYMNDMEHGKRNPSLKLLQAIADFHHIKLSRLFALAERKYERSQAKKRSN